VGLLRAAGIRWGRSSPARSIMDADRRSVGGDDGFADLSCQMEGTVLDPPSVPARSSSTLVFIVAGDRRGTHYSRCRAAAGRRRRRWVAVSQVLGSRPRCQHAGWLRSAIGGVAGDGFSTAAMDLNQRAILVILIGTDRSPRLSLQKSWLPALMEMMEH
ncbi:hypothetical protein ACLOJK_022711, partial [Asimina triloba]